MKVVAPVNSAPDSVRESVLVHADATKSSSTMMLIGDESLGSTGGCSVVSFCSNEVDEGTMKKRTTVGFREDCNVTHESNVILTAQEAENLWYAKDEIVQFYDDCQRIAGTIQSAAKLCNDPTFWLNRLVKHYQAFCSSNDAELEGTIMGSPAAFDSAVVHGLAIWACAGIDMDLSNRYQSQKEQILLLQKANVKQDRRAEMIRRASCTWSRPARLLARHLAQAAAVASL